MIARFEHLLPNDGPMVCTAGLSARGRTSSRAPGRDRVLRRRLARLLAAPACEPVPPDGPPLSFSNVIANDDLRLGRAGRVLGLLDRRLRVAGVHRLDASSRTCSGVRLLSAAARRSACRCWKSTPRLRPLTASDRPSRTMMHAVRVSRTVRHFIQAGGTTCRALARAADDPRLLEQLDVAEHAEQRVGEGDRREHREQRADAEQRGEAAHRADRDHEQQRAP